MYAPPRYLSLLVSMNYEYICDQVYKHCDLFIHDMYNVHCTTIYNVHCMQLYKVYIAWPLYYSIYHVNLQAYFEKVAEDTVVEDTTGCCIRKDLNACWQSERSKCTSSFAEFKDDKVSW